MDGKQGKAGRDAFRACLRNRQPARLRGLGNLGQRAGDRGGFGDHQRNRRLAAAAFPASRVRMAGRAAKSADTAKDGRVGKRVEGETNDMRRMS